MVFNDLFCLSHLAVHTLSMGTAQARDFDEHLKTLPLLDQRKFYQQFSFLCQQAKEVEKLDLTACLAASPHDDKINYLIAENRRLLLVETVQRSSSS